MLHPIYDFYRIISMLPSCGPSLVSPRKPLVAPRAHDLRRACASQLCRSQPIITITSQRYFQCTPTSQLCSSQHHDVLTLDPLPTGAHQRVTRCEWSTPTVRSWQPTDPSARRECECPDHSQLDRWLVGWLWLGGLELNWCSPIQRCGCMPSSSCQRRKCPNVACDSVCASSDAHHHKRAVLPTARLSKCQNDDRPATRIIIVSCVSFNDMMSECGLVRCVLKNEFSQRPVTLTMISVQLKIQNVTY